MKFQKPSKSDEVGGQDFLEAMFPFIANVPLLLYPQEEAQHDLQVRIDSLGGFDSAH